MKIIAEHKLPLTITKLMGDARAAYQGSEAERRFAREDNFTKAVGEFFRERFEFYLRDVLGFKYDVVNAVLAVGAGDVVDAVSRAKAVTTVRPSSDFESISIAFKRIKNILRQAAEGKRGIAAAVDATLLQESAERELAIQIPQSAKRVGALRTEKNYEQALQEISKLRPAVDLFFDKVMIMVEDERIRANRLALLQTLLREFSTIADFSEIVTEGREAGG